MKSVFRKLAHLFKLTNWSKYGKIYRKFQSFRKIVRIYFIIIIIIILILNRDLGDNQITGTIPDSIGNLTVLRELLVYLQ